MSRLGQVGDTRVRAHEDVAGVQGALQETLFGLRYMDAAKRSLRKRVGRHKSQAVHPDLVDAVYGLETHKAIHAETEDTWRSAKLSSKSGEAFFMLQRIKKLFFNPTLTSTHEYFKHIIRLEIFGILKHFFNAFKDAASCQISELFTVTNN